MTGPDRSQLPHGMIIPVDGNTTLSVNISQLGTLSRFPPDCDPVFTLCGRIILEWSMVEALLRTLIAYTWRNEIVAGIEAQSERPKSLKRRLAFLRKAFRETGPLAPVSAEARNVLRFVRQTGRRRHDIAHLDLSEIALEDDTFKVTFVFEGKSMTVTNEHLSGLLHDVYECQNALMSSTWNYAALFHKVAPLR